MSVDNVQSKVLTAAEYKLLTEAQKEQYALANDKEKANLTIQFRSELQSQDNKGLTVEENPEVQPLSEEELAAKAERHQKAVDELAQIKQMSASDRALADEAAENVGRQEKTVYNSAKIRKELRRIVTEELEDKLQESKEEALAAATSNREKRRIERTYKNLIKSTAKAKVESMRYQDKVEHTTVYETAGEKRAARAQVKDQDPNARLRVLNRGLRRENNDVIRATADNRDVTAGEALLLRQDGHGGVDNRYQRTEVEGLTNELGMGKRDIAVRTALRKSGFKVEDDTVKNITMALVGAGLGTIGGAHLPVMVKATAEALAVVANGVTGEVLAEDHVTATASGKVMPWGSAAIASGTTAVLAAAIFGDTKDENILRETNIRELFKTDPDTGKPAFETMTFGNAKNTEKVKMVLSELNKLDLSYEAKTQYLLDAAGERSSERLSPQELMDAYVNALLNPPTEEELNPKVDEEVVQDEEDQVVIDGDGDDVTIEDDKPVQDEKIQHGYGVITPKQVLTETKIKHRSNELNGYVLASQGYTREDGKALTQAQIKELIDNIYTRNNVRQKGSDGKTRYIIPKEWALSNQVTLSDGTVVNLKPEDELNKIKAPKSGADSRVGYDKNKTATLRYVMTGGGFIIYEVKPDGSRGKEVYRSPQNYSNTADIEAAAKQKIAEIEADAQ